MSEVRCRGIEDLLEDLKPVFSYRRVETEGCLLDLENEQLKRHGFKGRDVQGSIEVSDTHLEAQIPSDEDDALFLIELLGPKLPKKCLILPHQPRTVSVFAVVSCRGVNGWAAAKSLLDTVKEWDDWNE
jgi:hypothetical protein